MTDLTVLGETRVRVTTETSEFESRHVIVTAGAWTQKLIGDLVPLPALVVTQEQPAHFAARDPLERWPGFNHYPTPDDRSFDFWPSQIYGMLAPGEGVKVGWHGVGPVTDPDARSFASEPVQLAALRRYVREWLPGADPDNAAEISCTYTTTPDTNFVLKRFGPDHSRCRVSPGTGSSSRRRLAASSPIWRTGICDGPTRSRGRERRRHHEPAFRPRSRAAGPHRRGARRARVSRMRHWVS